jgi:hypothetical protein
MSTAEGTHISHRRTRSVLQRFTQFTVRAAQPATTHQYFTEVIMLILQRLSSATRQRTIIVCLAVLLALAGTLCRAQNSTGTIDGLVRDTSGAVVAQATVTVFNSDTGVIMRKVRTDRSGRYEVPALLAGNYTVTVAAAGFETSSVKQVKLDVDQALPVDVQLHLGAATAEVTVTANQLAPNLENNAAQTLIEGKEVTDLPLDQRNFLEFLSLQPGVNGGEGTMPRGTISISGQNNQAKFSVNGQGHGANGYFFDGADFLNHDENTLLGAYPSIDAIQQVNLLRDAYGAQYGGNGAAIVHLVSKSGTSRFHGTAYFFFRNQRLQANGYFNDLARLPKLPFRYNNFGYSLGGPVLIPHVRQDKLRTYFFLSQEFLRSAQAVTLNTTDIPTLAQRNGTFSTPVCPKYDSTGKCIAPLTTSITNIDPLAAAYLKDMLNKIPVPNSASDPQGLIAQETGTLNNNQTIVRIDHTFSDKFSAFFRFLNDPTTQIAPEGMGANGTQIPGIAAVNGINGARNYLGQATLVPSSNWVIEGGFSYLHAYIDARTIGFLAKTNSPDINPILPFTNGSELIPTIKLNNTSYRSPTLRDRLNGTTQEFVNVTHLMGPHTLLFGFNAERIRSFDNTTGNTLPTFTFKAPNSVGNAQAIYNQSFADFLIGYATAFSQSSPDQQAHVNGSIYEGYLQDNFKASPRLMLYAGVRYTFFREPTDMAATMTNFDPGLYNPANAPTIDSNGNICTVSPCTGGATFHANYDPINGLIIAGQNSPFGKRIVTQPNLNFAPRLGFAWNPGGDGKTSIRGGYGVFFLLPGIWENNALGGSYPLIHSVSGNNTSFDQPSLSATSKTPAPPSLTAAAINQKTAYLETFNLDIQRQLPGRTLVDVGYYGNVGRDLSAVFELNQPAVGAYVTAGIAAPGGITSGAPTTKLNRIRPYPGYASIAANLPYGTSNYNSLQTQLRKQFSSGSLGAVYTWSRALTIGGAQDFYNIAQDYGPDDSQINHIFAAHGVYELPWYRNQRGVVGHLLGGFELSGIANLQSGHVHTPTISGADPAGISLNSGGSSTDRPDRVADPNNGPKTVRQYFNTSAFAAVPASQVRTGNASVNSIYGPNLVSFTVGLMRNISFNEYGRLQLRAEAYNIFNHTNFTGLSTNMNATNYGQLTGAGRARDMQFAAKYIF